MADEPKLSSHEPIFNPGSTSQLEPHQSGISQPESHQIEPPKHKPQQSEARQSGLHESIEQANYRNMQVGEGGQMFNNTLGQAYRPVTRQTNTYDGCIGGKDSQMFNCEIQDIKVLQMILVRK